MNTLNRAAGLLGGTGMLTSVFLASTAYETASLALLNCSAAIAVVALVPLAYCYLWAGQPRDAIHTMTAMGCLIVMITGATIHMAAMALCASALIQAVAAAIMAAGLISGGQILFSVDVTPIQRRPPGEP